MRGWKAMGMGDADSARSGPSGTKFTVFIRTSLVDEGMITFSCIRAGTGNFFGLIWFDLA